MANYSKKKTHEIEEIMEVSWLQFQPHVMSFRASCGDPEPDYAWLAVNVNNVVK